MPYVKRDSEGEIIAIALNRDSDYEEYLEANDSQLAGFSSAINSPMDSLRDSDQGLIRVLDDLVELLTAKGVILFTDLPESAQEKIILRKRLRQNRPPSLNLLGED